MIILHNLHDFLDEMAPKAICTIKSCTFCRIFYIWTVIEDLSCTFCTIRNNGENGR